MSQRTKQKPALRMNGKHNQAADIAIVPPPEPIRLDFGCGPNKRQGFTGVDCIAFPGVDVVTNLASERWPWADDSVTEAHASHFIEHLTNFEGKWERVHFFNELFRILIPGGIATLIFPHWCSTRYYGDPTHREPFSEMGFFYLKREWRLTQAPHTDISNNPNGYSCDFDAVWGNVMRPEWTVRNQETNQFASQWYKEAIQDLQAQLTKPKV